MTTKDKIKEVLKKVAEDLEVDTTYIEEKNVHLDRIVEITLKSCSEDEKAKVEKLKEVLIMYQKNAGLEEMYIKHLILKINKLFSPEADLQEKK